MCRFPCFSFCSSHRSLHADCIRRRTRRAHVASCHSQLTCKQISSCPVLLLLVVADSPDSLAVRRSPALVYVSSICDGEEAEDFWACVTLFLVSRVAGNSILRIFSFNPTSVNISFRRSSLPFPLLHSITLIPALRNMAQERAVPDQTMFPYFLPDYNRLHAKDVRYAAWPLCLKSPESLWCGCIRPQIAGLQSTDSS